MAHVGIMPPATEPVPISIPLKQWWPYALFTFVVALFLLYIVGAYKGATSLFHGHYVHEFVHDARHLLGFPCH